MKKHNFILFLIICVLFFSCKSVPVGNDVSAIELLDNESSFYIAIPKAADQDLITRIIQSNVEISEKDAKTLSDRIDKVYCGLNRSKNHTEIQVAVDTSIPQKYIPSILNSKNGWTVTKYTPENSVNVYPLYSYNGMTLAFPSDKLACLGRDVEKMLSVYDKLSTIFISEATLENIEDLNEIINTEEEENSYGLAPELYAFLEGAEDEIRFCANKPQSFLTLLTGAQLDLKLIDVSGSFVQDPNLEKQYILNLTFNFKNETYLKAGKSILSLAFGLTNSQSEIIGGTILKINGIRIDKNQLYKLIVI